MKGALAVVLAVALTACSHDAPRHHVATHGKLLSYIKVGGAVRGATTYKIRYTSRSVAGRRSVVSGVAVVPTSEARNRVVVAYAHGTTGLADACAPSADPESAELHAIAFAAVGEGWILAATDYEGLGTPGRHPYLVGRSEGRSVLDAALAARQLPAAHASARTLIAGYSQGGHAALWANQLAKTWAPQLDVLGTFAGAPATEVERILAAGRTRPIQRFVLAIVGGYAAAYPHAQPARYLTAQGLRLLPTVDRGCIGSLDRATRDVTPAELVRPEGPTDPQWQAYGRANDPGRVKGESPVLIVHSSQDDVVPVELSALLHARMCEHGAVVERRVIRAGGHGAAALPALIAATRWLRGRVAGQPAKNDC